MTSQSPGRHDRHGRGHGTVVGAGGHVRTVRVPPPLADDQKRCPVCRQACSVTSRGYLRKHTDLFGKACGNKATGERFVFEIPPVVIP